MGSGNILILLICNFANIKVYVQSAENVKDSIEQLTKDIEEHKVEVAKLQERLKQESDEWKVKINQLEADRNLTESKAIHETQEMKDLYRELSDLRAEERNLTSAINHTNLNILKLESVIDWLSQDLYVLEFRQEQGDEAKCLGIYKPPKAELAVRSFLSTRDNRFLQAKLRKLKHEFKKLALKKDELQIKLAHIQEEGKIKTEQIKELIQSYNSDVLTYEETLENIKGEIKAVKADNDNLKQTVEKNLERLTTLNNVIKTVEKKLRGYSKAKECYKAVEEEAVQSLG